MHLAVVSEVRIHSWGIHAGPLHAASLPPAYPAGTHRVCTPQSQPALMASCASAATLWQARFNCLMHRKGYMFGVEITMSWLAHWHCAMPAG